MDLVVVGWFHLVDAMFPEMPKLVAFCVILRKWA